MDLVEILCLFRDSDDEDLDRLLRWFSLLPFRRSGEGEESDNDEGEDDDKLVVEDDEDDRCFRRVFEDLCLEDECLSSDLDLAD